MVLQKVGIWPEVTCWGDAHTYQIDAMRQYSEAIYPSFTIAHNTFNTGIDSTVV